MFYYVPCPYVCVCYIYWWWKCRRFLFYFILNNGPLTFERLRLTLCLSLYMYVSHFIHVSRQLCGKIHENHCASVQILIRKFLSIYFYFILLKMYGTRVKGHFEVSWDVCLCSSFRLQQPPSVVEQCIQKFSVTIMH